MKPSETAELLALAAAFDQRTIGEADVAAWQAILSDLDPVDCLAALRDHYAGSRERIMPVDIREGVRRIRNARWVDPAAAELLGRRPALESDDVRALRRDGDLAAAIGTFQAAAKAANAATRTAVLAYPDLAAALTGPVIGYASPEQWDGYVPPETFDGSHNDSPRRAALVEIVTEALRRQAADGAA